MKSDSKKPVYWISGNWYDCQAALSGIRKKHGDYWLKFDGTSDSIDKVILNLMQNDLFDKKQKVIYLKGLPEDYQLLAKYLHYVRKNCVLVIESPLSVGNKNIAASKLYKEIKKTGTVFEFKTIVTAKQAQSWSIKVAKLHKKTLEEDAAEILVFCKNNNLDLIYEEIGKLATYIGNRKKITIDDVKSCIYIALEFDTWKFIDSLTEFNLDESMKWLEIYFSNNDWSKDIMMLIGSILYRFELLLLARESGKKVKFDELKNKIGKLKKKGASGLIDKYSDGALKMFLYSDSIKRVLSSVGTIRLAELVSVIYFVQNSLRAFNNDPVTCRFLLMGLVQVICGKINVEAFYAFYEASESHMTGIGAVL